jgi:aminoglycoside phosphotransferase (APT) family kinase protein
VRPLVELDTGFGSVAVETAGGVVFRVARHAGAAEGHALEARLLPLLRRWLPVAVPDPRWRVEPGPAFPFGAIGYRRLAGEPLSPGPAETSRDAIAADLAGFLVSLHGLLLEDAHEAGLPVRDRVRDSFPSLRRDVLPVLRERLTAGEYDEVSRWAQGFAADENVDSFAPAVRHGDLWFGNVLVDGPAGRVVGVVDWENAAIGDPASDLARQLHLGEAFAAAVLREYRACGGHVDDALRHRIRRRWELLEFAGIRTAAALGDEAELAATVEKLRAGPILGAGRSGRGGQSEPG